MNISIPGDLEQFIESVVRSGTYENAAAVVTDALRLLERREQLKRAVAAGLEQLDRGQYTEYGEESLGIFLEDVETEQQRLSVREGRDE